MLKYGCTVWVQEKCSVGWLTSPEFTKTTHADTNWSKLFCTPPQGGGGGFLHTFCITPRHAIPPGGRKTSYTSYNRLCALFCYMYQEGIWGMYLLTKYSTLLLE